MAIDGAPPAWTEMIERWHATSPLTLRVRADSRSVLAKVGRWMADQQAGIDGPAAWTRQTCASWVAALDRMHVGDYVQRTVPTGSDPGEPLEPKTKAGYLRTTRRFSVTCRNGNGSRADSIRALPWPPRAP
jgi:hypothetical protein